MNKKSAKTIFLILLLLLAGMIILMLTGIVLWILSMFNRETIFMGLQTSAAQRQANLANWFGQSGSWIQTRYLFEQLVQSPVVLLGLILAILLIFLLVFFLNRTFKKIDQEQKNIQLYLIEDEKTVPDLDLLSIGRDLQSFKNLNEKKISLEKERAQHKKIQYENVLHQVRSSLNSLYFIADELPDPSMKEELEEVVDNCNSLIRSSLIDSVYGQASLKQILELTIQKKKRELEHKNLSMDISIETDAQIVCDATWIGQSLETILANSIEAAPQNSQIQIRVLRLSTNIQIQLINQFLNESFLETGNPRRYQSKSAENSHFGIGLDIVRETMTAHHGKFEALTTEGKAIVKLTFPIHDLESGGVS